MSLLARYQQAYITTARQAGRQAASTHEGSNSTTCVSSLPWKSCQDILRLYCGEFGPGELGLCTLRILRDGKDSTLERVGPGRESLAASSCCAGSACCTGCRVRELSVWPARSITGTVAAACPLVDVSLASYKEHRKVRADRRGPGEVRCYGVAIKAGLYAIG